MQSPPKRSVLDNLRLIHAAIPIIINFHQMAAHNNST